MLKLGICTAAHNTPAQSWWRRGLTAANMLPKNPTSSRADLDLFDRIIAQLRLSNGTVRTTGRNRLTAVDEKVGSILPSVFSKNTPLLVEDWAVSSGLTAAEWFQSLQRINPDLTFAASDWILYLVEVRRQKERDAFIVEPSGDPIQYIRAPFVVSLTQMQHSIYFINRSVQRRAMRKWRDLSKDFRVPKEWGNVDCSRTTIHSDGLVLRRLPVIHPQVMQMCSERFRIKQHCVFSPLSYAVDIIRTMNILNQSYFTVLQLRSAAHAIRQSLRPGGLWIVGRTVTDDPPKHEVTVLQNASHGWEPILRMGRGSEIESVVSAAIQ